MTMEVHHSITIILPSELHGSTIFTSIFSQDAETCNRKPEICCYSRNLQKTKGTGEMRSLMGDPWVRKRSSNLRSYHTNYERETWTKLLQCLSHEGLRANGKVMKPVLKERFKSFNAMLDEIHRTQTTWVVSDKQLHIGYSDPILSVVYAEVQLGVYSRKANT
nr:exocyst complex component EXO70B1 [Tanacetum cinerariifolium]